MGIIKFCSSPNDDLKKSFPKEQVTNDVKVENNPDDKPFPEVGVLKMSPTSLHDVAELRHDVGKTQRTKKNTTDHRCTVGLKHGVKLESKPIKTKKHTVARPKKSLVPKNSTLITDYYPVRRSNRKTKSMIKQETENLLVAAIRNNIEDGLKVVDIPSKGRGVIATKHFHKGDFVVEYAGDRISWEEARQREVEYSQNPQIGCYMYYFSANGNNFCIDATAESGRLGRLLNHSRRNPNCCTKLVWISNIKEVEPHLVINAKRDITKGEELTYDYGDRDKKSVENHPWLKL